MTRLLNVSHRVLGPIVTFHRARRGSIPQYVGLLYFDSEYSDIRLILRYVLTFFHSSYRGDTCTQIPSGYLPPGMPSSLYFNKLTQIPIFIIVTINIPSTNPCSLPPVSCPPNFPPYFLKNLCRDAGPGFFSCSSLSSPALCSLCPFKTPVFPEPVVKKPDANPVLYSAILSLLAVNN